MNTINELTEVAEILLRKDSAIFSDTLLQKIEKFKQYNNFYVYPLSNNIIVSFILSMTDNIILNKTYYKEINGTWKIHRDGLDASILNYNVDGTLSNELCYIEGKNSALNCYIPLKVFYIYKNQQLAFINFYYERFGMEIGFENINYNMIDSKISKMNFLIKDLIYSENEIITSNMFESIVDIFLKSSYLDFYNIEKIKPFCEVLKIINH
jgi:hypothetical protein